MKEEVRNKWERVIQAVNQVAQGGYRLNNPANIPSNHMTEDEFLALKGLGSAASGIGIDRYAGANMYHLTNNL